jgi:hypothetical protein
MPLVSMDPILAERERDREKEREREKEEREREEREEREKEREKDRERRKKRAREEGNGNLKGIASRLWIAARRITGLKEPGFLASERFCKWQMGS